MARVRLPRLSDRGVLVLLILAVGLAGWPSLSALLPAAGADTQQYATNVYQQT